MARKSWLDVGPSLILAAGILLGTFIAVLVRESRGLALTGLLLQALSVVGADVLFSRLRGESSRPGWTALVLAGALFVSGGIVALRDPRLVIMLLPTQGTMAWLAIFMRSTGRDRACRWL